MLGREKEKRKKGDKCCCKRQNKKKEGKPSRKRLESKRGHPLDLSAFNTLSCGAREIIRELSGGKAKKKTGARGGSMGGCE